MFLKLNIIRYGLPRKPELLPAGELVEEEVYENFYDVKQFFPVKIGSVLGGKYKVIGKLGYGGNGTVWLCRDKSKPRSSFVTVKVGRHRGGIWSTERRIYKLINEIKTDHLGRTAVRPMLDSFKLNYRDASYGALVHPPLAVSLFDVRRDYPGTKLPLTFVKPLLGVMLYALDFIHGHGIIHTDISEGNIMFELASDAPLKRFEVEECFWPSARKQTANDISYYKSRSLRILEQTARPVLTDFGLACHGASEYTDYSAQPVYFRSPEVLMHMPWNSKIDIWNCGALSFTLLTNRYLFSCINPRTGRHDPDVHAEGIAKVIGNPDEEFLREQLRVTTPGGKEEGCIFFLPPRVPSLKAIIEAFIVGEEEQRRYLHFLQRCLEWKQGTRANAKQLLAEEFVRSCIGIM